MRVVASIEARMGSSRLPGKVLADIAGAPALTRMVRRLRRCQSLDGIILATSINPDDAPLMTWAASEGVDVYRGSEDDVLARVVGAHQQAESEVIVEICGDCPLIDAEVIDTAVATFLQNDADVVSNTARPGFPQGADAQVFHRRALEDVAARISDPAVREHVSLYFYENPKQYRIIHLAPPPRWRNPDLRLQMDYPEDLAFIRAVYSRLEPVCGDAFGLDEILALLAREPELSKVNAHCVEKSVR